MNRLAMTLDAYALFEANRIPDGWRGLVWAFIHPALFHESYGAMKAYITSAAAVRQYLQEQSK